MMMNLYYDIPHSFITYEEIIADPVKAAIRLATELKVEYNETFINDVKGFVIPNYCSWGKHK